MTRWPILFAIAILGFSCAAPRPLYSQPINGYYSATPAFSPWLNLYRQQGGPLDPYHMYVQPDLQLRNTLQMHQMNIQRNFVGMTDITYQMSQRQAENALPGPTGVEAGFLTHGYYFNTIRRTSFGMPGATGATMTMGIAGAPGAAGSASNRGTWTPPAANTGTGAAGQHGL